ncbi:MAG: MucR family transcriptional regulator [Alphaproteobacteria bacterium]
MTEKLNIDHLLSLTSDIVSAHVSNNSVPTTELPALIQKVYGTLTNVQGGAPEMSTRPLPAVSIKKSVTPDYLVCLEDGKKLKMLKRHLKAVYGMSLQDYKARWGLPADYPTVAPNYAIRRSSLAKTIGLGHHGSRKPKVV